MRKSPDNPKKTTEKLPAWKITQEELKKLSKEVNRQGEKPKKKETRSALNTLSKEIRSEQFETTFAENFEHSRNTDDLLKRATSVELEKATEKFQRSAQYLGGFDRFSDSLFS